jgi:aspartyl-tRNA(Asn)/glutamyl-tRNA(Gln) amidotransferase subunit B
MNSTKNLHDGLAYEICRQAEVLEGGGVVLQETRHWEPASKRTYSMRLKETADDYRYFPEPDLAPFDLSNDFVEAIRERLPELPDAKKRRYIESFGLPASDAQILSSDVELSLFFDAAVTLQVPTLQEPALQEPTLQAPTLQQHTLAKPIANLLLNDVAAYLNANNLTLSESLFTPAGIAELAQILVEGKISSKQAKEVFSLMVESGASPLKIVEEKGMQQVSDTDALEVFVETVLAAYPEKVAEYREGKTGLLGFFVGMVMKETKGQGNPKLINEVLLRRLGD